MEGEDYRDSDVEADSDHEDQEDDMQHSGQLDNDHYPLHFSTDLDSSETGTVRRRAKTIVTPKMAMESFRLSFLNDDQEVNFDAILGELSELETQLTTTQTQLSQSLGGGVAEGPSGGTWGLPPPPPSLLRGPAAEAGGGCGFLGGDTIQAELDALAAEITSGLGYSYQKTNGQLLLPPATYGGEHISSSDGGGETDSAFSDNTSLPSSESYTSMATVSSSAETTSSSSGETCSITSAMSSTTVMNEMQRLKAEKIRIALEKIKEAKIRKLFVRAFAKDGSSKSILVDEKMTVGQVCSLLADKHHGRLTHSMAVIEHMPELFMERILEDHDSLVENMVMWTRDSKNKVLFEERWEKYNLFFQPEKYLLCGSSAIQRELGATQREQLIQEFFSPAGLSVPEVEGALYLKSDGKKAWKKYFFVLRASGLYYNPKGKVSKAPKDLVCLVQFEFVEVYRGLGWKKKYHSPTDCCFALKHPQIQKKTSRYIRYFCAESEDALDQWIMGIRMAKLGKQVLHNFEHVHHEIATWDLRQPSATPIVDSSHPAPPSSTSSSGLGGTTATTRLPVSSQHLEDSVLNPASLHDGHLSLPEASPQHSIVTVHSSGSGGGGGSLGRSAGSAASLGSSSSEGVVGGGGEPSSSGHQRKGSEGGESTGGGHKTPTKRVSFSTTHSIISDSCQPPVSAKHRDSIVSAATDSSEDSNSSGESRQAAMANNTLRGKMRPKLPVTTETTRLLTEMNQLSFDGETPGRDAVYEETSSLSSASSTSSSRHPFSRSDRWRSSTTERRGSDGRIRTNGVSGGTPMSPKTGTRRASHEGSPMRHSGMHQWMDDYYHGGGGGMEGGSPGYKVGEEMEDQFMYAGMTHYEQIPCHQQQQQQQQQQQLTPQQLTEQQQYQLQQYQQQQREYEIKHQHYLQQQQEYEEQLLFNAQQQLSEQEQQQQQHLLQQQHQLQQQSTPQQDVSDLYATVTRKASQTAAPVAPCSQTVAVGNHQPPPPLPSVPANETLPPPPQFQESLYSNPLPPPPPPTQPKASAPPTAPKPSGPPPPPPTAATHKQPPPPVLPKSVPASSQPAGYGSLPAKPSASNASTATAPVATAVAVPRPGVPPPPVPPLHTASSPPTGKVGPPTLPKSAAAAPVSSHGDQVPIVSSSSAPPTLSKAGTLPRGYGSGEQPSGGPSQVVTPGSSPHRVSHIKHPSTGSPMLGLMGPTPPRGPTPSDSGYIEGDTSSSCSGSPSNPAYLQELARRREGPSPGTSPPQPRPHAPTDGSPPQHASSPSTNHRRSASAGSAVVKGAAGKPDGRKAPPPPPPKRSENTRLTGEVPKPGTPPASPSVQKNPPLQQHPGPIYENCEGIMDINELPPPPPELLAGLPESAAKNSASASSGGAGSNSSSPQRKGQKLPPPPPRRSKETHLTQPH